MPRKKIVNFPDLSVVARYAARSRATEKAKVPEPMKSTVTTAVKKICYCGMTKRPWSLFAAEIRDRWKKTQCVNKSHMLMTLSLMLSLPFFHPHPPPTTTSNSSPSLVHAFYFEFNFIK